MDREKTTDLKSVSVKRGCIYLCDLGIVEDSEQGGIRPVLVIKNQKGCDCGTVVTIVPITSRINKGYSLPTHVSVGEESGLIVDSELMIEQIKIISKRKLLFNGKLRPVGEVSDEIIKMVQSSILKDLGFVNLYFSEVEAFRLLDAFTEIRRIPNLVLAKRLILNEFKDYCGLYNKDYNAIYRMYTESQIKRANAKIA